MIPAVTLVVIGAEAEGSTTRYYFGVKPLEWHIVLHPRLLYCALK